MEKFVIEGGIKLSGKVKISGAKNSALALMPATLLNSGENIIKNTPEVNDIYTMIKLLKSIGVEVQFEDHILKLNTGKITSQTAPYEHVKKMRASVYVMGPLLSRYGYAKVSLPGGCAWGPRPINLHIESLQKMGANIELDEGYIVAKCKRLTGNKINFNVSSVGATGNVMMAACLAKGSTIISNAAVEPEIILLAEYLQMMGARINGIGTRTLEIEGVDELYPSYVTNICDRIEAGTLLIAALLTGGNITIEYPNAEHLESLYIKLEESGANIIKNSKLITITSENDVVNSVDVSTGVFPGFPTDLQAQWTALMTLANGTSTVTDTIYIDRFKHVPELNRLGADIEILNNSAVIKGVKSLKGAKVMSTDLRASASLVIAGLRAEGITEVLRIYHIDRGYEKIEEKLKALGAKIDRVETDEF